MAADDSDDRSIYTVVVNDEGQYSIWPSHKAMPQGWRSGGKEGRKDVCLNYIDEVWTDMRPLSLQRAMETGPRSEDPS